MDRSTDSRCRFFLLIGLLCLGVLLQILGMPLTFWDLDGSCNPVESSLLEGVAIISAGPVLSPVLHALYLSNTHSPAYRLSAQYLFFHPPPPMVLAQVAT